MSVTIMNVTPESGRILRKCSQGIGKKCNQVSHNEFKELNEEIIFFFFVIKDYRIEAQIPEGMTRSSEIGAGRTQEREKRKKANESRQPRFSCKALKGKQTVWKVHCGARGMPPRKVTVAKRSGN